MPGDELRLLRKGIAVVFIALIFSVTAYAFSGVYREQWSSRLEKGEYRGTDEASSVFVIVAVEEEPESTPTDVVISEPLQIIVASPDEVDVEIDPEVGDHNE